MEVDVERAICKQCKKTIVTVYECQKCLKDFHRSCASMHKVYNSNNEIVKCDGVVREKINESVKNGTKVTTNVKLVNNEKSNKRSRRESGEGRESDLDDKLNEILGKLDDINKDRDERSAYNIKEVIIQQVRECKTEIVSEIKNIIAIEVENQNREIKEQIRCMKEMLEQIMQSKSHVQHEIEFKNNKSINNKEKNNIESYAQKARKVKVERVVVEPIKVQSNEETLGQIKNKVDVMSLGISVNSVRNGQKGTIIVECEKSSDKEKLTAELKKQIGDQYKIKTVNKKLPKIKIIGIEENLNEIEETDFIKKIIKQNELDVNNENIKIKVIKKIQRTGKEGIMILEIDPKTHKIVVELQKLKIGWKKCRVFDYVSIIRCYKCWGYSHYAQECKNNVTCRKCAGNHDEKECQSQTKKCANCISMVKEFKLTGIDINHEITDKECESYKRMVNKAQKSIIYYDS